MMTNDEMLAMGMARLQIQQQLESVGLGLALLILHEVAEIYGFDLVRKSLRAQQQIQSASTPALLPPINSQPSPINHPQ